MAGVHAAIANAHIAIAKGTFACSNMLLCRVASPGIIPRTSESGKECGGDLRGQKVVLAYSFGLDTSVILRWLQGTYRREVVTFTADLGQESPLFRACPNIRIIPPWGRTEAQLAHLPPRLSDDSSGGSLAGRKRLIPASRRH
jgi:hypothetical protein